MHTLQYLRISIVATSLVVLAGCTAIQPVNTNTAGENANTSDVNTAVKNTNGVNTNVVTEEQPVNDNDDVVLADTNIDNINSNDEIDTSDWLTYTNEEYGFSFRYPEAWGEVVVTTREAGEYQTGSITQIIFDNDRSRNGMEITVVVKVETTDYQFTGPADGENIPFTKVDLTQSEDQLREVLKRHSTIDNTVKKITTLNNINGLMVDETVISLGGEEQNYIEYLFPKFNSTQTLNMRIYGKKDIKQILEPLVDSFAVNS